MAAMRLLVAMMLNALGIASAADAIAPLQFADYTSRSLADFTTEPVVMVYFSGECPTAAKWMGTDIRQVYNWLDAEHIKATLMLITPDVAPGDLGSLDRSRHYNMVHALYARDPTNQLHISLSNIYQIELLNPDGTQQNLLWDHPLDSVKKAMDGDRRATTYQISRDGLNEPAVVAAWWAVERDRPGAVQALMAPVTSQVPVIAGGLEPGAAPETGAAPQTAAGPVPPAAPDPQHDLLVSRVTAYVTAREAALCALPDALATYEAIDRLLKQAKGLELPDATKRLKDLGQLPALRDELKARKGFLSCQYLLRSPRTADQTAAKQGLAKLATQYPTTAYGKQAADLLQHLPPAPSGS